MTMHPRMIECLLALSFLAFFLALAFWSNLDLSGGRYMLYMDELITHDEVRRILESGSLSELVRNIASWDQRYGRTLYFLTSVIAFPAWLFGSEQDYIIATRMAQALFLGTAYVVLSFLLIRNNMLRMIAMLTLIALPSTAYYATMPKPEPLQLLFLSVFLWLFLIKKRVTGWSWLLLGLTFGAKISVIVLIPVFTFLAWLAVEGETIGQKTKVLTIASVPWFLLGWLVSVPVVLTGMSGLQSYLNWTFLNVGHGADSAAITIVSWLERLFSGWISYSPLTTALVFGGILGVALVLTTSLAGSLFKAVSDRGCILSALRKIMRDDRVPGLVVLGCGLLWAVAIMFGVKRLWAFYLHIPLALIFIGGLMCAENLLAKKAWHRLLAVIAYGIMALNLLKLVPDAISRHEALTLRSTQDEHARKEREYGAIMGMLDGDASAYGKQLRVLADPQLYLPRTDARIRVDKFYGPFKGWENSFDVIIAYCFRFSASEPKEGQPCALKEDVASHVTDDGMSCKQGSCYVRRTEGPDQVVYLSRKGLGSE